MTDTKLTPEGLRAAIGLRSAVMLVIGGVIGVGIFVNPSVVARSVHTPALALAAWALGGVVALLGALKGRMQRSQPPRGAIRHKTRPFWNARTKPESVS